MTQDEIIEMARQAEIIYRENVDEVHSFLTDGVYLEDLEAFAKLVEDAAFKRWAAQTKLAVEAQRETCAKICESEWTNIAEKIYGEECAKAIRARDKNV
jgi:hypothetical protein